MAGTRSRAVRSAARSVRRLCKAFAVGHERVACNLISEKYPSSSRCPWLHHGVTYGYVSVVHDCCRTKESALVVWHLSQAISAGPADSAIGYSSPSHRYGGGHHLTEAANRNDGRSEKHSRHHKQLPGSGWSLTNSMDMLVTLISQGNATWLILHMLCSLEEGKNEKPVNNTQYSACLRAATSRHSCWFHRAHASCRDLP